LVFISHDSRDATIAEEFEILLNDASGGMLKSFRSSDRRGTSGIEFGTAWYAAVMDKLDEATDVVALLTERSLERPWILYEVGVARGRLLTTAFGLAIGLPLSAITGPFAQLQNSDDDEDSLTKLVLQLIRRNPEAEPREEAVRRQVAAFRAKLPQLTGSVSPAPPAMDAATVARLFEEVKEMFRQLPTTIATSVAVLGNRERQQSAELILWRHAAATRIADLQTAPRETRPHVWEQYLDHFQEGQQIPDGAVEIWDALNLKDEKRFRRAAERFLASPDVQRENEPTSLEEVALNEYVSAGAATIREWLQQLGKRTKS